MTMRSKLGLYFIGHQTTLNRILYMLCSPKVRFTPTLSDEYAEYNVSGSDLQSLKRFIENGGADTFRNSINRQKFVPVTQADIEYFLFGLDNCYQEITEPWTSLKVNFSNLFGMCILDESEYIQALSDGLEWSPIGHGVYRVSKEQENLWDSKDEESITSYENIFENPPKCSNLKLLDVNSSIGYEQKILHLCFEKDREGFAFPLTKISRIARRFGTKMLFYFEDRWDGNVSWFYSDCKIVNQTETNSKAIENLDKLGLENNFSRAVFKHGPQERDDNDFYGNEKYNDFDPIAEAISHVEQSRD